MTFGFEDVIAVLALRSTDDGWLGDNLDVGYHRVFGGQVLAQTLVAASRSRTGRTGRQGDSGTGEAMSVKSLHVLFPREGDTDRPVQYRVTRLHSGRTFGGVEVVAHQGDRVIAVALVSLHVDESGLDRDEGPPEVGAPEEASPVDLGMVPWETRVVGGVDLADRAVGPARLAWWSRTPPVDGGRELHQALLAHATDLTLIGTALRPFDGLSQADSTVALHTAVTSHTLWFHRRFRVDDWLLVTQEAPVVSNGRSYGRGDVFSDGRLVASFAQEAMIRRTSDD